MIYLKLLAQKLAIETGRYNHPGRQNSQPAEDTRTGVSLL